MPADDLVLDALGRREARWLRDAQRPAAPAEQWVLIRPAERDALVTRARAHERIVARECITRMYSSAVCQNGTPGCEV
jgi:hypothetical protein